MMIDADQARAIAQRELDASASSRPLRLADQPIDRPNHWVFGYNSVEYYETGNPLTAAFGRGPIAVSKLDGTVIRLKSALRVEDQV
jgi:immunity protein 35 of polymorphic toxin system